MRGREFKDAVFTLFAQIAGAFASPKRLEIIDLLAQGERNVETIAAETGLTVANASQHLQVLRGANLVSRRKEGLLVFYRLADARVLRGYRGLQELSEARLAEVSRLVDDYFRGADGLEPVGREVLLGRARRQDVLVLDVRPAEEYAAGHIPGATSVPLADLERRLAKLPRTRRIVAYCRGSYCVLAAEAVRLLRSRGFHAVRLKDGFPEWRDAGLPIEEGKPCSTSRRKEQSA